VKYLLSGMTLWVVTTEPQRGQAYSVTMWGLLSGDIIYENVHRAHVYIHVYVGAHIHMHVCKYTPLHALHTVYIHLRTHTHALIHMGVVHTHPPTCMHRAHTHIQTRILLHTHTHMLIHTYNQGYFPTFTTKEWHLELPNIIILQGERI